MKTIVISRISPRHLHTPGVLHSWWPFNGRSQIMGYWGSNVFNPSWQPGAKNLFGHYCWDLEKIKAGVEWRENSRLTIHIRSSLNKALLEQGWGKQRASASDESIHLFWSTGQSSEAKPQTPSQTKVENRNTIKTLQENGNLGKVKARAKGEDGLKGVTVAVVLTFLCVCRSLWRPDQPLLLPLLHHHRHHPHSKSLLFPKIAYSSDQRISVQNKVGNSCLLKITLKMKQYKLRIFKETSKLGVYQHGIQWKINLLKIFFLPFYSIDLIIQRSHLKF